MSMEALNSAWETPVPTASIKFVLVALACYANEDGLCWPSISSLSTRTKQSTRAVQKALVWLVEHGHVSYADGDRSRGGVPGQRATTRYKVHPQQGCTLFTGERGSPLNDEKEGADRGERGSPVNGVHPRTVFTGERGAGEGCTTFTRTISEPSVQEEEILRLENPDRGEPRSPVNHVHPRTTFTPDPQQKRKGRFTPQIPEDFGEGMRKVLTEWIAYQSGRRKPLTEHGWNRFMKRCREFSEAAMVAAMNESMDQGWQGVFPDRHKHLVGSAPAEPEKKFTGAAAAGEPEWDWQALYRDRFDCEPDAPWQQLHPDMRAELLALHERRGA